MLEGLLIVGSYPTDPNPNDSYKGFDGQFWPGAPASQFLDGLAPICELDNVISYFNTISRKFRNVRLICISGSAPTSMRFKFVGFDAGVLESSYNHFSIILNDIVNPYGAFTSLAGQLNESKLFSDKALARSFCKTRAEYKGEDVEVFTEGEKLELFPIWLYSSSSQSQMT